MNGLSYAYLGDAVYELEVREYLISKGYTKINRLHKEAIRYTNAKAQAGAIVELLEVLSEDEVRAFKQGRNSSAKQTKKTASMMEYKLATGLESLIGNLYMKDSVRMKELVKKIIEIIEVQHAK